MHKLTFKLRKSFWETGKVLAHLPAWLLAFVWRSLMVRTTFIAVTGSLGKTTAKDCIAAILSSVSPTVATVGNSNGRVGMTRTIFRVRPWHRYAVIETGTDRKGGLVRASLLVRPDIALVLSVARCHSNAFRTLDEVAAEKVQLLRFLRRKGTVVLNGDDARVAAMRAKARGSVVTFGEAPAHDVVASDVHSRWPERLRFRVASRAEVADVETQLVGTHWVGSALGALAVAAACGLTLTQAAKALRSVAPHPARLQPAVLPSGAVVLRDDYTSSIDSFQPALDVLRSAQAERRIVVLADCSDMQKTPRKRMSQLARMIHGAADMAVFVGEFSGYGAQKAVRAGMDPSSVHACLSLQEASDLLRSQLRAGDLVLLRGDLHDHLSRIYFRLLGDVECTTGQCRKRILCDACNELGFTPDSKLVPL